MKNYTDDQILKLAKKRKDLWYYDDDCLLEYVRSELWTHDDIEEIFDHFSMLYRKEELFDYLNNILFDTYDEIIEAIKKWFNEEKSVDRGDYELWELASEFIDSNELYDIDYDD